MEPQRPFPFLCRHDSLREALPLAPRSPSHFSPQCSGCLLLFDCLTVKVKALGAFETSAAVCQTSQRYVPRSWVSRRTSRRRGWCLTLCDLRSSCGICDIWCIRVVAVPPPDVVDAAVFSTAGTWIPSPTYFGTWIIYTCVNWRTLCDNTVRDNTRDNKC